MEFELMRLFIVAIMALAFGMGTVACDKKSGSATATGSASGASAASGAASGSASGSASASQ